MDYSLACTLKALALFRLWWVDAEINEPFAKEQAMQELRSEADLMDHLNGTLSLLSLVMAHLEGHGVRATVLLDSIEGVVRRESA